MLAIEQCSTGFASFSLAQEKVCKTCGESRLLSEFVASSTGKYRNGRKNICKPCQRVKNAERQKANPGYWAERRRMLKSKSGETVDDAWKSLDAALGMFQRTTHSQRAV